MCSLQKSKFRYQDILVELPISIHNSHLLTSFLHQLPKQLPKQDELNFPASLADISRDPKISLNPLVPNIDALDLSIDPYLEKTCDLLLDSIENHQTEQNNFQYWQRALGRAGKDHSMATEEEGRERCKNGQQAASLG